MSSEKLCMLDTACMQPPSEPESRLDLDCSPLRARLFQSRTTSGCHARSQCSAHPWLSTAALPVGGTTVKEPLAGVRRCLEQLVPHLQWELPCEQQGHPYFQGSRGLCVCASKLGLGLFAGFWASVSVHRPSQRHLLWGDEKE